MRFLIELHLRHLNEDTFGPNHILRHQLNSDYGLNPAIEFMDANSRLRVHEAQEVLPLH